MATHDEIFQELTKRFPGLMEYLFDGHYELACRSERLGRSR